MHANRRLILIVGVLLAVAFLLSRYGAARSWFEGFEGGPQSTAAGPGPAKPVAQPALAQGNALLPAEAPGAGWAANPVPAGSLEGQNFLAAGAHIGVNSVGQTRRNASLDLRGAPVVPKQQVSPWLNSTIEPDLTRRGLGDIGLAA